LERGAIFADPLAVRILGEDAEAVAREAEADPSRRRMRSFIAVRTRFAEDALAAGVERGVRQLVVLGAGLDTLAYRSPFGERLRIFEVDHPARQAWKRERLAAAGIAVPGWLTFAPLDFEREALGAGLEAAGFDPAAKTFFTWLGVVPYLSEEAVLATLGFIARLSGGASVVFDYGDPPETLSEEARAIHDARAARVEAAGESWVTYFEADSLRAKLMGLGFTQVEDLGPASIAAQYFPNRGKVNADRGGHILRAATI
jgi:methyltransferase (TIGR00027 family)